MKYDFDKIIDRRGTYSSRWTLYEPEEEERPYGDDYIYLSTADMDFQCSDAIKGRLKKVVEDNLYGYTQLTRENGQAYFEAVQAWFQKSRKWNVKTEQIFYVVGSMGGARTALETFTKAGDGVLINRPVYGPFQSAIEGIGRRVVNSPLVRDEAGYYTLDFEDIERQAAQPDVTAYLLCSPHNLVGRVWTEEELRTIHDICRRNGVIIISDEVHADFIWKGVFRSIAQITDGTGIITCTGFGKTFNLAALEPANVIITDPKLRPKFEEKLAYMMPNRFTIEAIMAACLESDDWLAQVRAYLRENIDAALNFLKQKMPKVKCVRPEGGYMLWMDFSAYGLSEAELHRRVFHRAQVVLEDGSSFDPDNGSKFLRACLPAPRSRIMEALERISKELP